MVAEDAALAIARRLVDDAVWHQGRCTWLAPEVDPDDLAGDLTWRTVGPSLYDGAAGIGMSLAEIGVAEGDPECVRTAIGALRHALAIAGGVEPRLSLGVYSGAPGVALAALRTGQLTGEDALVEAGHVLLMRGIATTSASLGLDLVGGSAGAIVALLAGSEAIGDLELRGRAAAIADELASRVAELDAGASVPVARADLMSSGLAHGPSGVGYALLELWAATGRTVHRQAADDAFAREDRVRDSAIANWPATDFDPSAPHAPSRVVGRTISHVHWCHGAPGIGLARHRAWSLTADPQHRVVAEAALKTTKAWVVAALAAGRGGFCLCHGLAGNAEILRDCADAATGDVAALRALVDVVADEGVGQHLSGERPWPCGTAAGESPGLMTGLAGIARFYLRRAHPEIPSILLLKPEEWRRSEVRQEPDDRPKVARSAGVASRVTRRSASDSTCDSDPQVVQA